MFEGVRRSAAKPATATAHTTNGIRRVGWFLRVIIRKVSVVNNITAIIILHKIEGEENREISKYLVYLT